MEVIAVDTSAFVAIATREPDRHRFEQVLSEAQVAATSAVSVFETRIVLGGRGSQWLTAFDRLLVAMSIQVAPFDAAAALAAHDAYRRWGKGAGSGARLNLGDCAAYALAMSMGVPLLYKGDDFRRTDVASALPAA